MPVARAMQTDTDLERAESSFPQEAYEALFLLASGYTIDQVFAEVEKAKEPIPGVDTDRLRPSSHQRRLSASVSHRGRCSRTCRDSYGAFGAVADLSAPETAATRPSPCEWTRPCPGRSRHGQNCRRNAPCALPRRGSVHRTRRQNLAHDVYEESRDGYLPEPSKTLY